MLRNLTCSTLSLGWDNVVTLRMYLRLLPKQYSGGADLDAGGNHLLRSLVG
jgi:hypothetical protein